MAGASEQEQKKGAFAVEGITKKTTRLQKHIANEGGCCREKSLCHKLPSPSKPSATCVFSVPAAAGVMGLRRRAASSKILFFTTLTRRFDACSVHKVAAGHVAPKPPQTLCHLGMLRYATL